MSDAVAKYFFVSFRVIFDRMDFEFMGEWNRVRFMYRM